MRENIKPDHVMFRASKGKRRILSILEKANGRLSANDIYRFGIDHQLDVPLSTIYRALERLTETGDVERFDEGGAAVFALKSQQEATAEGGFSPSSSMDIREASMRILLAEDDTMIGERLQRSLTKSGHAVDWITDGARVNMVLATQNYDMLLLDLALPNRSGLEILNTLRRQNDVLPVIIITAKDSVPERIEGLDAGADDYLVKPFALDELDARMRALQRRRRTITNPVLEFGRLTCNPATREVRFDSEVVKLTGREYQILLMLMLQPGAIVSRREIDEQLYNFDTDIDSNAIEVHIFNLRQKLGTRIIRTVRGLGYQLVEL